MSTIIMSPSITRIRHNISNSLGSGLDRLWRPHPPVLRYRSLAPNGVTGGAYVEMGLYSNPEDIRLYM